MKWTPWIAAVMLIVLTVALTVTIVNRLSDREVALIVGAVCGAGVATPLGVALGLAFAAQRQRDRDMRLPPVIYVPPSLQPVEPAQSIRSVNAPTPPRRSYSVIGGNDLEAGP